MQRCIRITITARRHWW